MSEHHHDHGGLHHLDFESPDMAMHGELEGEALIDLVTEATGVLAEAARRHGLDVRRVLDLGCGPGVGTCCLAGRFESATVLAVDSSATMLEYAEARAARLGLAQRVQTHRLELPGPLDELGRAEVAWMSMALHHVGDEAEALRQIRAVLAPGGLLAVLERADPLRVVPEHVDLGRPGIWDRLDAAWAGFFDDMRGDLPGATTSADYPSMLRGAGFELLGDDVLTLAVDPPLDAQARRFAHQSLQRVQAQLEPHADAADLAALDVLLDEDSDQGLMRRGDALIRATRHLFVGRAMS